MDMLTNSGVTAGRIPPFSETLINKRAVAAFLGMTESGFTKLIHRGEGPPYLRIGRLIRFSPTVVKAWVAAQIEITEPVVTKPDIINS
jgi:predicted DNA-binding transcriptional regulator AlpA